MNEAVNIPDDTDEEADEFRLLEDMSPLETTSDEPPLPWQQPPTKRSEAEVEVDSDEPIAHTPVVLMTLGNHRSRAHLAEWLELFLVVVIAMATVSAFYAIAVAATSSPPDGLHGFVKSSREFFSSLPEKVRLLTVWRTVSSVRAALSPLECVGMGAVLLVLAIRLMLRARMLSAVYVRSGRWRERSGVGLVLNFFVLLLQVLLVAWAASLTKVGADGITPGIVLVVLLVIGAAWLFILHLAAHGEPPRLPQRAISSSAFALAIIIILLWPEAARLWTRNGAVIVLALAESGLAFHLGAGAGLRDDPAGPWKQKIWCTAAGCVILVIAAGLLAVIH